MKHIIALMVFLLVVIAGCAPVPDDVAQATIEGEVDTEESHDSMEEMDQDSEEQVEQEVEALLPKDDSTDGDDEPLEAAVEEVPVTIADFTFEGYAPGKSHDGTFSVMEGTLFVEDDQITGMEGTVDAASVDTGIPGLDSHLKNEDFFDVEQYPTIAFSSSSIEGETMTGDLTFLGVTKEVAFPVEVTENGVTADFLLDTTPFGMKYIGIDKEVRISFDFRK